MRGILCVVHDVGMHEMIHVTKIYWSKNKFSYWWDGWSWIPLYPLEPSLTEKSQQTQNVISTWILGGNVVVGGILVAPCNFHVETTWVLVDLYHLVHLPQLFMWNPRESFNLISTWKLDMVFHVDSTWIPRECFSITYKWKFECSLPLKLHVESTWVFPQDFNMELYLEFTWVLPRNIHVETNCVLPHWFHVESTWVFPHDIHIEAKCGNQVVQSTRYPRGSWVWSSTRNPHGIHVGAYTNNLNPNPELVLVSNVS